MGVFEKLPYLNYHDINLDWLVRQTKKNASDNSYLMKIFKWFQDNGLVGVVTEITENPDDTVKIEYTETETQTTDDFTVYDKNGVDGLVSGLSGRIDDNDSDISDLQGDVTGLDNRLGTAEGDITNLQGRMGTAEGDITSLQTGKQNTIVQVTDTTTISNCFLYKWGQIVTIICRGSSISSTGSIGTLPDQFRLGAYHYGNAIANIGGNLKPARLTMESNGTTEVRYFDGTTYTTATAGSLYCTITYIIPA